MGDPVPVRVAGPRTFGAVWPVDAYSLAVACGGRGVSLDIWPASHSAPAAPRAVRLSGHDRDRSPSRTTRRATTWFPPRRSCPAGAVCPRLGGPPWPSVVRFPPRATTKFAYRCLCDASTAYAAALQRGTGAASRCCFHTPGSSSRQRRQWRPVCAGHLSTASSRGHQHSSWQSPWRDWPQGRFGAPSLPESPRESAGTPHRECDVPRRGRPAVTGALRLGPTRPTNTATARMIVVSWARVASMPGRSGFAARRTLRPLSTAISRTSTALPRPSNRSAASGRRPRARPGRPRRSRPHARAGP